MAMENPTGLPITETILAEAMLPKTGEVVLEGGEVIQLIPSDTPCFINNVRTHRDHKNIVVAESQRRAYFSEGRVLVVEVIDTLEDHLSGKTRDQLWHVTGQGFNPRFKEESQGIGLIRVDRQGIPVLDFVYDAGALGEQEYGALAELVREDLRLHMYIVNRVLTTALQSTGDIEIVAKT